MPSGPARAEPGGQARPLPPDTGTVLEVSDLSVEYITDTGSVVAVDHVSFGLGPGEFIGIVGESGCGKSTLLFGIAQLLSPPARISGGTLESVQTARARSYRCAPMASDRQSTRTRVLAWIASSSRRVRL